MFVYDNLVILTPNQEKSVSKMKKILKDFDGEMIKHYLIFSSWGWDFEGAIMLSENFVYSYLPTRGFGPNLKSYILKWKYEEIESFSLKGISFIVTPYSSKPVKCGLCCPNAKDDIEAFNQFNCLFYEYKNSISNPNEVSFYLENCKLIFDPDKNIVKFNNQNLLFSQIRDVEVLINDGTIHKTNLTNAIVGDIIAGGIGAIIGASTNAKNKRIIYSVSLLIKTFDLKNPIIEIIVSNTPVESTTNEYDALLLNIQKIMATFELIMSKKFN